LMKVDPARFELLGREGRNRVIVESLEEWQVSVFLSVNALRTLSQRSESNLLATDHGPRITPTLSIRNNFEPKDST
jgi:hypothetical protein